MNTTQTATHAPEQSDALVGNELNFIVGTLVHLSETKPLGTLLDDIISSSCEVLGVERSSLALWDERSGELHFQIATGTTGEFIKSQGIALGVGIAGWVAEHRTSLCIHNCYDDPRFNPEFDKALDFRSESMICAPMIHKGKLIGVIQAINKRGGGVFTQRDIGILEILAMQCAVSIENARLMQLEVDQQALHHELRIAREIQKQLLPSSVNFVTGLDTAATLIPAKQVAGDYYDVLPIDSNTTLFAVCDVSGKSVSAALIVSILSATIRTYIETRTGTFDVRDMVHIVNRVLIATTTSEKFVTAWFGLYEHDTRRLHSINAGHNIIYVHRAETGECIELSAGGFVLGAIELPYDKETVELAPGDRVLWYTDGVPEAMNAHKEQFGDDRMLRCLQSNSHRSSADLVGAIVREVQAFASDAEQSDDITCGVMHVL